MTNIIFSPEENIHFCTMYKVMGNIWIEGKRGAFVGSGRIKLLERVKETGSITEAARSIKMSYRQAWELINSMNKQSKKPLVIRLVGGAGGGGTTVTKEGEKVIKEFKKLQAHFEKFVSEETKKMEL